MCKHGSDHSHDHHHGHDPKVLSVYRSTFPNRETVLRETPDPAVREMLGRLSELGCETCFDRFDAQQPQCNFGLAGSCCRNCAMGPCKVTNKAPRGVCGADEDLIVARNLLRWMAAAVASHGARGREVMLALKAAADGRLGMPIRGEAKVRATAKAFGLPIEGVPVATLASQVADVLLDDLSRTLPGPHRTLHAFAPPERLAVWRALDILPVGSYHEVFEALHRTGTGTDGDYRNVMRQFLRCGLAFSFGSVLGSAIAMDCLHGPPRRDTITANLGTLTQGTVNIALHGHSPVLVDAIVTASRDPGLLANAQAAGAAGIRLYGICCSGLSAMYRRGSVHPLANALGAELAIATGALDLWVADMQDVYPSIMDVATCVSTPVITTSDSCHLPGAEHIGLAHDHGNLGQVPALGARIVGEAIESHVKRRAIPRTIPAVTVEAEVGFSVEALAEHFAGLDALAAHIHSGRVRGVVNLVGCSNPKVVYEKAVVDVAKALLGADVALLTNGCASFPLLKLGLCGPAGLDHAGPGLREALHGIPPVWHMGECLDNARASALFRALAAELGHPLRALPFAFASPEWSNEKGVGAALSFRLLGLDSYHCVHAPVFGSAQVQRFLVEETRATLGGAMIVDPDPSALAQRMIGDLSARRQRLGWSP